LTDHHYIAEPVRFAPWFVGAGDARNDAPADASDAGKPLTSLGLDRYDQVFPDTTIGGCRTGSRMRGPVTGARSQQDDGTG